MRVLIVGSDQEYSIENYYVKYLSQSGVLVSRFLAQKLFYEYYQKNIFNKVLFRAGLSWIYKDINEALRKKILSEDPKVIMVFKGLEVLPSTILCAKSRGIKLINYNTDNPFIFSGRGSGNDNITQSIGLYDLHLTYNLHVDRQLKASYDAKTSFLPFGFEISDQQFQMSLEEKEIVKVCFLGNPDKERSAFIKRIADSGITVDVYGHDWSKFLSHANVEIHDAVYGDRVWKILRRYRVQLNLMRVHNLDSHNMRSFEVPGIGGIMVAPDTTEHRLFFEHGKEAFFFRDAANCIQIIQTLLHLPEQEAFTIRYAARERSIISGYSYQHRTAQALKTIKSLLA